MAKTNPMRLYHHGDVPPIPRLVYHASPYAAEISVEGMRIPKGADEQTFGGHAAQYVSATTLEIAMLYAEALRDVIRAARGEWGFDDLDWFAKKWMGKKNQIEAWINLTIPQWLADTSRYAPHKLKEDLPLMWMLEHVWVGSEFPLFFNLEAAWPKFKKMKPEQVGLIEIEVDPRIEYRRCINNVCMKGAYSFNESESEWRIHDLSMIKSVRRIA